MHENWIPEERDSSVMELLLKNSAIESLAMRYPMRSDTYDIGYDEVLRVEKLGAMTECSIQDLEDPLVDFAGAFAADFVKNAGVYLDSMCLGAVNPPSTTDFYRWGLPMNHLRSGKIRSLYTREGLNRFHVRSEDPGDLVGLLGGLAGYARRGTPFGSDTSIHNMDARPGIIAHPKFRKYIDPKKTGVVSGLKVKWSMGCAVSEEPSQEPEGNPLLYVGNVSALKLGVRSGPETSLQMFDQNWAAEERRSFEAGENFLTNQDPETLIQERLGKAWLKIRIRRGFVVDPMYPFQCVELVN